VRPPEALSDKPGLHRFFWDMHGKPLPDPKPEYPMTAIAHQTAPRPTAPWAVPGSYSVVLTSGGQTLTQPLILKMDPRVKATTADLTKQFELSKTLAEMRATLQPIGQSYEALATELSKAKERAGENPIKEQIKALHSKLETLANPADVRSGDPLELDVFNKVEKLFGDLEKVDAAPTPAQHAAMAGLQQGAAAVLERWEAIAPEVAALNAQLASAGLEPIKFP
jgi:hypothetical protein